MSRCDLDRFSVKALAAVLDPTRLKVLDIGAARLGLFGSALESLGPAGLAAALKARSTQEV